MVTSSRQAVYIHRGRPCDCSLRFWLLLAAPTVHAEKRVAHVIRNRDYKASVGPLANPLNDIRLVADALKSVGYEVLHPTENASRIDMLRAIYGFASALKDAGPDAVGFLYYSGHGLATAGENYLVPIDVTEPSTLQPPLQSRACSTPCAGSSRQSRVAEARSSIHAHFGCEPTRGAKTA
jgi:Caspase domain